MFHYPNVRQALTYPLTKLDQIEIDGEVINGYMEYSFLEEKSYATQPTRANDGSIIDIDDYTTFLTPRIIIKYSMMNIDDYRKLMQKLNDTTKNAHIVSCYDIVKNERVWHEMYFAPTSMPIIYQKYLIALGVQDFTIELIGTNNPVKGLITLTIVSNLPADAITKVDVPAKKELKVMKDTIVNINYAVSTDLDFLNCCENKGFDYFIDNNGNRFQNPMASFSSDTILYAEWY